MTQDIRGLIRAAFDSDSVPQKNIALRKAYDTIEELVGLSSSACTLLEAHAALYRKEGEENAEMLDDEAASYRRHLAKVGGDA